MAPIVTLLGGESTGKTTLTDALSAALADKGVVHQSVPEHLRQWCEQHGRAPQAHEQADIANTQAHWIDTAARVPGTEVVIADTGPLVVAAYSDLYFNDRSLWPAAVQWQRRAHLTLLMGLDLPWVPDGLFRDSPDVRSATDSLLRHTLQQHRLPFQTVYGQGEARVQHALRAIGQALGRPLATPAIESPQERRPWTCEKCSDPDCEHRLFSRLFSPHPPGDASP